MVARLPFENRVEAGQFLAEEIAARELGANVLVVALPRGGVAVGFEAARKLSAPLDVVVVRKLGVPGEPELAMGAICGNVRVLDQDLIRHLRISQSEIEEVVARETEELKRRETLYRARFAALEVHGRAVALVDDGLATGSTMLAAARHMRTLSPQKLIAAVPVASEHAFKTLSAETDECIALATPEPFYAVGEAYRDFRQVSDAEVEQMLTCSRT